MKKLFNRTLSILCAVMLLISAVSMWAAAEEEPATPTDLNPTEGEILPEEPSEEPETDPEAVPDPEQLPQEDIPEEIEDPSEEQEEEPAESTIDSVEVIITKTLTVGQTWSGTVEKAKPAILKLDVSMPGSVYMLVEGKDVWASVEKSDRVTENPARTQTDPETEQLVFSLQAEEGSYLITVGPVEPNLVATAKVTFMDVKAYEDLAKNQIDAKPEETEIDEEHELIEEIQPENERENDVKTEQSEPTEENQTDIAINQINVEPEEAEIDEGYELKEEIQQEAELENDVKTEQSEPTEEEQTDTSEILTEQQNKQEELGHEEKLEEEQSEPESEMLPERNVTFDLTWDTDDPMVGDTAHLKATLIGYEDVSYSLQWQSSPDDEIWTDAYGETAENIDILITEENNFYYWRLLVYIEEPAEE